MPDPSGVIVMQRSSDPLASMPGPSRRITVEPIRLPTHAPPVRPEQPPRVPERERPPAREPVPSR
jgi:hypothetical protein